MYSAYILTDTARKQVLKCINPSYDKVYAHHVTVEFGIKKGSRIPDPANIRIIGYLDSGDGLDVLLVTVNNEKFRPDGKHYHITLSIDSSSEYKPKNSNDLILDRDKHIVVPIHSTTLQTIPRILH